MSKKLRKLIPIFVVVFVAVCCVIWIAVMQLTKNKGLTAEVRVSGKTMMNIPLSVPSRHDINGANGIKLIVVVENGSVYVEHSDCPDKICENMGKKSSAGDTIICLPAQTVIEVKEE